MTPKQSFLSFALLLAFAVSALAQTKTENVILITFDGARTQEVFGGLDLDILKDKTKRGKVEDSTLYKKYWAATPEERRLKLMPFFWGTLMKDHGSIAGNRSLNSSVMTTNRMWFSYPGYSEILTGQAHDDVINSNDRKRNQFTSVLEFLKRKLKLTKTQVALFGSWDVFNWIGEHEEGAVTINAGHEPYELAANADTKAFSKLQNERLSPWDSVRFDYFTVHFALEHLKKYQPRVMHIALGETDDWAHGGEYAHVLNSFTQNDQQIKQIWEFLQSSPKYKGKTSIIFTTDHGRGKTIRDWTDHGEKVPEAQNIWMAFISPEVSLRGEWKNADTIYQNQVAATLCRFLNVDYSENNPQAGKPVAKLFGQ
ncbi:MAG: phosphoglyceromutase [Acidobacteria bacterium]|nr:phosphoglyceromutase [Acidobacteriota bacterium]